MTLTPYELEMLIHFLYYHADNFRDFGSELYEQTISKFKSQCILRTISSGSHSLALTISGDEWLNDILSTPIPGTKNTSSKTDNEKIADLMLVHSGLNSNWTPEQLEVFAKTIVKLRVDNHE